MTIRKLLLAIQLCIIPAAALTADQVARIASQDLTTYLHSVIRMVPEVKDFNLTQPSDVDRAVLGSPVRVLAVEDGFDTSATTVAGITVEANRWFVPVFIDGTCRFFITVSNLESQGLAPKRVASGFAYLAAEYGKIVSAWPGHAVVLVSGPKNSGMYFTVAGTGSENLTPIPGPTGKSTSSSGVQPAPGSAYSVLGTVSSGIATIRNSIAPVGGAR